ncbi:LysR family transcriptional regulator [Gammaproteobacteria bacterium]|nr:LysR family transcriptional regulator [Gammaproteobacteria bacterium]
MNYTLRHLRYFVAAGELGSISAAAEAMNVSQPSIASAINHLEQELEVGLFLRKQSMGVTLTPAGSMIFTEARNLLSHAGDFGAFSTNIADEISGEIHIASFVNLAPVYLAGILRTFQDKHPGVTVRTYIGNQEEVLNGIKRGHHEIALAFDLSLTDEFLIDVVYELSPQLVVHSEHRLADAKMANISDVIDEPFIYLDMPHSRNYFFSLFSDVGLRPRQTTAVASFETIRTFVGNGLGFSVLNLQPRNATNYDGTKVRYIPIRGAVRPLRICCVRMQRTVHRRACLAFIDHVRNFFKSEVNASL